MSKLSSNAQQKISELKEAYINALPDKLADLNRSWLAVINESSDPAHLESLRVNSHKLAGSAGSYGLKEISNSAREFEKVCNEALKSSIMEKDIKDRIEISYKKLNTQIREVIQN